MSKNKNDDFQFDFFHIDDEIGPSGEEQAEEDSLTEDESPETDESSEENESEAAPGEEEPNAGEEEFFEQYEKQREKKPRKQKERETKSFSPVLRVALLAVVSVLVILILVYFVSNALRQKSGSADKPSFISLSADSVIGLYPYTDGVAVLKQNSVEYFDASGNEINSNPHLYLSPSARSAGKNLILFDKGGSDLRIEKSSSVYRTLKFDTEISAAAICENGTYAYVLNADSGYQSHLFVYTLKGKKLFEWGGSDYLLDLALSPNGKYVAMSFLTVDNAEYSGRVLCFNLKDTKPLYTYDFDSEAVYNVEFITGKRLCVLTGAGLYSVGPKEEKTKIVSFSSNELNHADLYPGGVSTLALNRYGNETNAVVTVFSKKLKKNTEMNFEKTVLNVLGSEYYSALVFSDVVETYDGAGVRCGRIELEENCEKAVLSGRRIYMLCPSGIYSRSATHADLPKTEGKADR